MPSSGQSEAKALSVSDALRIAKAALEGISVRIVGEVSELSANPRYKAVYFTVKDDSSALPCMMWSNRYSASGVELRIGALVEISGRFTLYAAKGRMNFDVTHIELAGEGRLRMQVAALAKRLGNEGLMDAERKKPLPYAPERIGVVTSPRGAAVYDVLRTLRRRFPVSKVIVAGVTVEGRDAPRQIIEGLDAIESAGADVVLLVRGGGSFEDLMPFNEEALARRIAAMTIPVITGIGHEPDTSIADMVSDRRASTPTAAAEAAVPAISELNSSLLSFRHRLDNSISRMLDAMRNRLDRMSSSRALTDPMEVLAQSALKLDDCMRRLRMALPTMITEYGNILSSDRTRIIASSNSFKQRFQYSLNSSAASLDALSPLAVLSRGYSISRDRNGVILRSSDSIGRGDTAHIQLHQGAFDCIVTDIEDHAMRLEETNE